MIKSLEEFKIYNLSLGLSDEIWKAVLKWNHFDKDTIGKQLVRSADSISANLSEGLGRFHTKEFKNFCFYVRGSLFETKTWLTKVKSRNLMEEIICDKLLTDIETLGKMLNRFINTLKPPPKPQDPNT